MVFNVLVIMLYHMWYGGWAWGEERERDNLDMCPLYKLYKLYTKST